MGHLPSLLTLLVYDDQIKKLIQYDDLFKKLQISGDFDNISPHQKISFINKISKGKISIITPCVLITSMFMWDLGYINTPLIN